MTAGDTGVAVVYNAGGSLTGTNNVFCGVIEATTNQIVKPATSLYLTCNLI